MRILQELIVYRIRLIIIVFAFLLGAPSLLLAMSDSPPTPGERFKKSMQQLADNCAKTKLKPGNTACNRLKLKPAEPLATEAGRFAHSIKIPNPISEDGGYKSVMTSEEYFEHLCKTEAGEFIFKTQKNVEGIYQMRPRKEAIPYELNHLYALEDPYGYQRWEAKHPQDYYVQPPLGKYQFLEQPYPNEGTSQQLKPFRRIFRGDSKNSTRDFVFMKDNHSEETPYITESKPVATLESRYGYTWRGIVRPHDREMGIAGGELLVIDLRTKEVLAVRRGFLIGDVEPPRPGFTWKRPCPLKDEGQFLYKVLKPVEDVSVTKE